MILIHIFLMFIKIALFNYGGGFAMIPLISAELEKYQWLSSQDFMNIIAISQMTPGAIAINTATFVGYKVAGINGAIVSTIAIPIPSLILIILLYPILEKHKHHPVIQMIFYGVRPVVAGLIIAAVYFVANTTVITDSFVNKPISEILLSPNQSLNIGSLLLITLGIFVVMRTKLSPILLMILAAVLGIILF